MSIKGLFADFRDYLSMKPDDQVRDFVGDFDWDVLQRNVSPNNVDATQHLAAAAEHSSGWEQRLLQSLAKELPTLHWDRSYTAEDFGQGFFDNYAYVEMLGTRGHYQSDEMAGGFFMMGPMQHYPSHNHVAEEICIPLTAGSYWMQNNSAFAERSVGDVIFHDSNEVHAMETPAAPLVALYLWRGGDLAQKPNF